MNTFIFTFPGGNLYNKDKQLEQVKKQEILLENNPIVKEVTLDSLDEELSQIKESKVIILREDHNLQKFENIVKVEYPLLKKLEVIPELFYRLKEVNVIPNQQQVQQQQQVQPQTQQPSKYSFMEVQDANSNGKNRVVIPINIPLRAKDYFDNIPISVGDTKGSYQSIVDISNGFWFPFLEEIIKYIKGIEEVFKKAGERDIPYSDIESLEKKLSSDIYKANATNQQNSTNIINNLRSQSGKAVPVYNLAQNIWSDVKKTKVKLDEQEYLLVVGVL